ncbi:hypothetical protein [Lyngbya aestuarii]|uniref:hypothetical protein n=1 Tax=Lyngbya aestuarii TaxID=118322 RepID=UPI00403D8A42
MYVSCWLTTVASLLFSLQVLASQVVSTQAVISSLNKILVDQSLVTYYSNNYPVFEQRAQPTVKYQPVDNGHPDRTQSSGTYI